MTSHQVIGTILLAIMIATPYGLDRYLTWYERQREMAFRLEMRLRASSNAVFAAKLKTALRRQRVNSVVWS